MFQNSRREGSELQAFLRGRCRKLFTAVMWPILAASTAVNPAATLSPAGLRVWLTEEGVAMLERSLAPVLGSIVCAAPVPRIARSFPGLEVTVDHMRLFDCETDALSLSPAVAVEGDVLAIQVDGLSAQFMADYCWGTGWGWATIWQCGPVEGTLKNGSSASLTLTARRGERTHHSLACHAHTPCSCHAQPSRRLGQPRAGRAGGVDRAGRGPRGAAGRVWTRRRL